MAPRTTQDVELVVGLDQITPVDLGRVGMKAGNLASLLQAGFPVPRGVVLTTDAYRRFDSLDRDGTREGRASSELRDLAARLVDGIGGGPVAVRSSAPAEDLPEASFAGQYETVLNVKGPVQLAAAIGRCWASASSPRATSYRDAHRMAPTDMAVLVQPMVNAAAAGVAFSANPVTGRRAEVVINAVRGLGDRLVSGEVTPDQWTVSGHEVHRDESDDFVISAEDARAIATLARQVEDHFGVAQDIEWAIGDSGLRLLQARPISSLPEPPVEPIPIELVIPPGFWMYDASHNPRPGYHVDLAIFPLIRRASQRWAAEFGYLFDGLEWTAIGMWPYQRMVPLGGREGPMPPKWLMRLLVRVMPVLRRRVAAAVEAVRSDKAGRLIERWHDEWQSELSDAITSRLAGDLSGLSDAALTAHLRGCLELLERGIQTHMILHGALSMTMRELATTCDELLGWDLARATELVSGTSHRSTEPGRRLHELGRTAAARPAVRALLDRPDANTVDRLQAVDPEFATAFAAYLESYAHRALGYTLGEPTLAEMPWLLLGLIRGQIESGYDPDETSRARAARRMAVAAEARARLADRPTELRRFERALTRAERAYPVREDNEFFTMSAPLALARYAVLEVGRRLAGRGVIEQPADVLHLELEQALTALAEGGDHRGIVERRKGERAWAELHPGPQFYGEPPAAPPSFDFLPDEARIPMEAILWGNDVIMAMGAARDRNAAEASLLRGIPASAGTYTGPARVVIDESQFEKIRPGDVLICPITSPVWSVLFPAIGALVTDTGGVLSHPAIIAREFGIPAVVATRDATSILGDGDLVTVDAGTGTVERAGPPMRQAQNRSDA